MLAESGNAPNWNFWKYLISHEGKVVGSWGPWSDVEEVTPNIRTAVHAALSQRKADSGKPSQAGPPEIRPPQARRPNSNADPVGPPPPAPRKTGQPPAPPPLRHKMKHDDL